MTNATITPTDNGPYLVQGTVTVLDADGNAYEVTETRIALCRCGHSAHQTLLRRHPREDELRSRQPGGKHRSTPTRCPFT